MPGFSAGVPHARPTIIMEASFEKLLVLLAKGGVRFVVVGGVAVAIQGYVRLTEDVDLLVDTTAENINRLLKVLSGYGEGFARELSPDDFHTEEGAIRIVEESEQMQIDLFTLMSGKRFTDVIDDADSFDVGGFAIAVASKRSLIEWKERSEREKDRLDVIALRQLLENPEAFD
jgi:predicted nucleotidyltransferase